MKPFYLFLISFLLMWGAATGQETDVLIPDGEISPEEEEESYAEPSRFTTYYFIRHAEKNRTDPDNDDPHLTQQGLLRAAKWSLILSEVKFDAIYSTDYNRTKETAMPLAETNGLEITLYDPMENDMKSFVEATAGKTVMVVGHSNTTPDFVNKLVGRGTYQQMDDDDNGSLYIVHIAGNGEKSATLLHLN